MSYINMLLPVIPGAIIITAIVYVAIYAAKRKRRQKPGILKMIAEYLLTGWLLLFVYVTQIRTFGNGMGELFNLKPFEPFYIAFCYGVKNAGMLEQYFLNILICVPLGVLLPLVSEKYNSLWKVFKISFAVTCLTEVTQLIGSRGTDIDDVIANVAGGLLGFSIFYLIYNLRKRGDVSKKKRRKNMITSICLILVMILPFLIILYKDGLAPYGHVYYGNLQPSSVAIPESISDRESSGFVYKYKETKSLEELKEKLKEKTGFEGEFILDQDTWVLEDGAQRRIFIYDYLSWSVNYYYAIERDINQQKELTLEENISLAADYLESFGVSLEDVYLESSSKNDNTGERYLEFRDSRESEKSIYWGPIEMIIGPDGELLTISDMRIFCEFEKAEPLISPRASITIAQKVGVGKVAGEAVAESVKRWYYFDEDTGYLIPTWNIRGKFKGTGLAGHDWKANISALQKQ